jgi:catechol 2,3-dioxygenase-like lactoylglutathione lyase family enzyme
MIFGIHLILYSEDATADRAFFRDVFGWETVDAGDGWLIFALPPTEAAVHASDRSDTEMYLMSTDLAADIRTLESKGIQLSEVERAGWGSVTRFRLPGGALSAHPSLADRARAGLARRAPRTTRHQCPAL